MVRRLLRLRRHPSSGARQGEGEICATVRAVVAAAGGRAEGIWWREGPGSLAMGKLVACVGDCDLVLAVRGARLSGSSRGYFALVRVQYLCRGVGSPVGELMTVGGCSDALSEVDGGADRPEAG